MTDRSRLPTGDYYTIYLWFLINRTGDEIEISECEDSHLMDHQWWVNADLKSRGSTDPEIVRYYPGVDIACSTCHEIVFDYLSYCEEYDRDKYTDDDGDTEWEMLQSDLNNREGMVSYAFDGDRGSKTECDNCGEDFFYSTLLDHTIHADAGGHGIRSFDQSRRNDSIVHGHLCHDCMDWFKGASTDGTIK
jgi:hypothetical protein